MGMSRREHTATDFERSCPFTFATHPAEDLIGRLNTSNRRRGVASDHGRIVSRQCRSHVPRLQQAVLGQRRIRFVVDQIRSHGHGGRHVAVERIILSLIAEGVLRPSGAVGLVDTFAVTNDDEAKHGILLNTGLVVDGSVDVRMAVHGWLVLIGACRAEVGTELRVHVSREQRTVCVGREEWCLSFSQCQGLARSVTVLAEIFSFSASLSARRKNGETQMSNSEVKQAARDCSFVKTASDARQCTCETARCLHA